jgi:DNA-binding transcriptional MerR regulator
MYSIGQLSQKTNLSIRTLRYYDEIGLLKPAKVAASGYRYYAGEELRQLQHITALKELGFTLSSIRELLTDTGSGESQEQRWQAMLDFELATVAQEKARLEELEKLLQTTRYALAMKGEIAPEDIFLFIQSLQTPLRERDSFLEQHFTEREQAIIKRLPDLRSDDPRSMQWAKLLRQAKEQMGEAPSSAVSQQLAAQFIEVSLEWFEQDEQLLEKYWALIRPDPGKGAKIYGLESDVMMYIDQIIDWYLAHVQGGSMDGQGKEQ